MAQQVPITFNIDSFDPNKISWTQWLKRFKGALGIFEIAESKKVPYLLHFVGTAAFKMLSNRLAPEDPYEKTFDDIAKLLQEFYEPETLEVAENFKLMQRKQQEGESVQDFLVALQKLSINCKMGNYTNTGIRNYFILGLKNKRIQNRLLETKDLTLEKAIQTATAMELSEMGTKQCRGEEAIAKVGHSTKKPVYKDKFKKPFNS
ncbi:hypothetical protein RF55_15974, partial [Lasius niger]